MYSYIQLNALSAPRPPGVLGAAVHVFVGVAVAVAGDTGGFGSAAAEVGMNTVPAAMARALMARTGPALRLRLTIIMFPLLPCCGPGSKATRAIVRDQQAVRESTPG
jgi:hypothetical protein